MDSLKSAVYVSLKRPVTFLAIGFIIFLYCLLETFLFYQPIELFFRFKGNLAETVVISIMGIKTQIFRLSLSTKLTYLFIGFIAIIVISIGVSIIISGYFYTLKNVVERKKAYAGEFLEGISKYFGKVFKAVLKSLIVFIIFMILLLIAVVPALIITNTGFGNGKFGIAIMAIILDIITVFMAFFVLMFLRMYLFFWFPSIYLSNSKKTFTASKKAVDGFFWDIVEKFIAFDIVFIFFQLLILGISSLGIGGVAITIFCDWVFKLVFFIAFTSYLFRSFKYYKDNLASKNNTAKFSFREPPINRQSSGHRRNGYS